MTLENTGVHAVGLKFDSSKDMQNAIACLERNGIKFEIVCRADYEKIVLTDWTESRQQ